MSVPGGISERDYKVHRMIYQDFCDMFWKAARMMKLNCNQIALYWCLLEHWKGNGYTSDLIIPNQDVMDELSITERALRDARKVLIDKNLISFESGHAKRHPTYKMLILSDSKPKAETRKKVETPTPSIDEVVSICMRKGMNRKEAEDFYYYYDAQGWVTSSGQKIKRVDSMVNRWMNNEKSKRNGNTENRQDNLKQQRDDEVRRYILGDLG